MTVKEYSAAFWSLAAKFPDWPESLLVDYYWDGLNLEILSKAIEHANPQTLVGWIQSVAEVKARQHLIKLLQQTCSPAPGKPKGPSDKGKSKPKGLPNVTCEQCFKAGRCLTCGGVGHFVAQCPSSPLSPTTTCLGEKTTLSPQCKPALGKPAMKLVKSTLADLLEASGIEDLDPEEFRVAADSQPAGNE